MSRPDKCITYLRERGYSVVRMPRSDLRPLQTLLRTGKKDLARLGELSTITTAGSNPLPSVSVDNTAPDDISGSATSSIKVEIGLQILGSIIGALGGQPMGLGTVYHNAKTLTFKFEDVLEDHVDLDKLDRYLSLASIKADQKMVLDALIDDAVYVITSVIKTAKITVNAHIDKNAGASVAVPTIQEIASANLSVDTTGARDGTLVYRGKSPIIFGFQATQLFYGDDGAYTTTNPLDAGKMAAKAAGTLSPTLLSLDEGVFFRLKD